MIDPNAQRAKNDWPPVVIASAFLTGVQVARDLTRRGVSVFLVDSDQSMSGFRSIHGETFLCPNADTEPFAWLNFLTGFAKQFDTKPVLLAASDKYVSAVGRFSDELAENFRLSSSVMLQAELAVKEGQIRLAQAHGLPIPHTKFAVSEQDVLDFANDAQFPVLFKPRQHRFWSDAPMDHPLHFVKAIESDSTNQLLNNYRLASEFAPEVILQEKIIGPDTNKRVHVGIYREDGMRLSHLTLKELRAIRLHLPTVNEPIDDPEIADIADRFFQSIGYRGTCEIEFMRDDRDGIPKMLDINPRFTGSGNALPYAGIDQAWLLYLDLINQPVQPVSPSRSNFRHVTLEGDMFSIRQYWQDGLMSWRALSNTYRPPVHFADIDLRDWKIAIPVLYRSFRIAMGTLLGILLGTKVARRDKAHPTPIGKNAQSRSI